MRETPGETFGFIFRSAFCFRCRRRSAEVSATETKQLLRQLLPLVSLLGGEQWEMSLCARARVCAEHKGEWRRDPCGFYAPMLDVFCVPEMRVNVVWFCFFPTFDCCGLWREVSFLNRPFVLV